MTGQNKDLKTINCLRAIVAVLAFGNIYQGYQSYQQREGEKISIVSQDAEGQRRLSFSGDIKALSRISTPSSAGAPTFPGWKPVYVYSGTDYLSLKDDKEWHGQLKQDQLVQKILRNKKDGYFIDLAAHDAVGLSNTYSLERDFGWNGLCIEMNHAYWYGLSKRKCDVVGALVGKQNDEELQVVMGKLHLAGIEFGGAKRRDRVNRRTAALGSVLKMFNVPREIDYFSLDVEGAEEYIMSSFPLDEYKFKVLTIERPTLRLASMLRKKEYTLIHFLAEWETLWVHNSMNPRELVKEFGLQTRWIEEKSERKRKGVKEEDSEDSEDSEDEE